MGCYSIEWKASAKKDLKKIDKQKIPKILEAVANLAYNPHPPNHKKIIGTEHNYRIRVGDYRVIYFLEDAKLVIEIVRVRHRKEAYSNL